jgi:hypothetical protein
MCIISLLPKLITINIGSRIFLPSLFVSCVCSTSPDYHHDLLNQRSIHWVCDEYVSSEEIFRQPRLANQCLFDRSVPQAALDTVSSFLIYLARKSFSTRKYTHLSTNPGYSLHLTP